MQNYLLNHDFASLKENENFLTLMSSEVKHCYKMNDEKICLLVRTCITYGRRGYLNLENQELICLYNECRILLEHIGDNLKNDEKIFSLVCTCITYGHLGYLNLDNQELICLYNECLTISDHFGDIFSGIQLSMLLAELNGENCFEECSKYLNKMSKGNEKESASAFLFLAKRYESLCKYQTAIECCNEAIYISKNLAVKIVIEGDACAILGGIYSKMGKDYELQMYSKNCIRIGKETSNENLMAVGYLYLGTAYMRLGRSIEAISSIQESIEIALQMDYKEILRVAYTNLAIAYQSLSNFTQAKKYFETGLKYLKNNFSDDREVEIISCQSQGIVCRLSFKYQKAINHYQNGLSLSLDIGAKHIAAYFYKNLGEVYWLQCKYHESKKYFETGLQVFKDIGNRSGEWEIYLHLARVYLSVGKFQKFLEYAQKSLKIAIESNDNRAQMHCYRAFGIIHQQLNKYEKAQSYHVKHLLCTFAIGDKVEGGKAICNIGAVLLGSGKTEAAIQCFQESLKIAISLKDKEGEAASYSQLGKAYFCMKRYDEAINSLQISLDFAKNIDQKNLGGCAGYDIGLVYYSLSIKFHEEGDEEKSKDAKTKAEENLKKALQCWEWELNHLRDLNEFKISIVDTFIATYKLLTKVLIERGKTEEALLISDRGRARSLGDILASKYGITEARYPSQTPFESTDLESILSSNQFCILFFAIGHKHSQIHAWALTHKKPIVYVNIDNQALTTIEGLQLGERSRENRSLFSLLITPVIQHLSHEEIVIIPDGPLYRVPFAALKDPITEKFLSETKRIRFSPSLATLKGLRECSVDFHSKTGALIVGDPDVGDVVQRGEKPFLTRLPSAGHEATYIGLQLGAEPLIASQATKEMVKQKLKEGVAVIHIAAHGDSEHGHIVLAPSPRTNATGIPGEQDYMLTMQEVQEIGVTAQLVVLSCCYSGRGDIRAEGVVGMSRAFLAAGARAVVASLWDINDEATLDFMKSFYASLKMGESASKSLQIAMDDIRGKEEFEDPKYWGPFFVIGDDVTISV